MSHGWRWNKDEGFRSLEQAKKNEEKPWDNVEEVTNDPRLGKRVFCLSLLPEFEVYGTIKGITRYSNENEPASHALEYWRVLTDPGMGMEAPGAYFELYKHASEFQRGDRVRHNMDAGGYWEGIILRPILAINRLRFVVRVENVQTRIKITSGSEVAQLPSRLIKL